MRVINIIPHPPAYEFMGEVHPRISWDQDDGTWVGIEPWDWSDQLAGEIKKLRSDVIYEVWQPDVRAYKVYTYRCDNDVLRKLFPAVERHYTFPWGKRKGWFSPDMIQSLDSDLGVGSVLHLNNWRDPFSLFIYDRYRTLRSFAILVSGHGGPSTPRGQMKITHRPWKMIPLFREQKGLAAYISRINVISDQNSETITDLGSLFKDVRRLTMGCDFDFWKPCPDVHTRQALRARHGIGGGLVMFSGANFIPRKQLDRFIKVLYELGTSKLFLFLLAGRGERDYEVSLRTLGHELEKEGRLRFLPYVRNEDLRELYWLSDLYISVAAGEGSSVGVMQAFATGTPVLSSDAGGTADAMREWGAEVIVPRFEYAKWREELQRILGGELPRPVDIAKARERYHWPNVATDFLKIYDELASRLQ